MEETEEDYRDLLNQYRVELVQCLDLDRQYIFSHLRSKFVLDDEDCEIILNAGPSRQQKSQKFIDMLSTKGPDAVNHFIDALEIEHPHLYEVFTGKKPVCQASNQSPTNIVPWAVLRDKHMLEQKQTELLQELEDRDNLIRELRREKKSPSDGDLKIAEHFEQIRKYSANCQLLLSSNNEKSEIIILLQSRLLATTEQIERSKNLNDQLRRKNEYLTKQVRDLTINCDWERIQSKRLSKQVDEKKTEIERNRDAKQKLYELKFEMMRLNEEKDESQQRLEEFKTVMAALNGKYKLLQQEKLNEKEKISQVSEDMLRCREQIITLQNEVNQRNLKVEGLHRENERLKKEVQTCKEQKDFYLSEREQATRDRDCAITERDNALQLNRELQISHDQAIRKQNLLTEQSEKRVFELTSELEKCKEELGVMQMKFLLHEANEERAMVGTKVDGNHESFETGNSNLTEEKETDDEELSFNWRERTKTEVLKSAYKKLLPENRKTINKSENRSFKISQSESPTNRNWNLNYEEMSMVFGSLTGDSKSPVAEAFQENIRFLSDPNSLKIFGSLDDLALPDQQKRSSMGYSKSLDLEHRKLSRQKGLHSVECLEEQKTDLVHSFSPGRERAYACAGLLKVKSLDRKSTN